MKIENRESTFKMCEMKPGTFAVIQPQTEQELLEYSDGVVFCYVQTDGKKVYVLLSGDGETYWMHNPSLMVSQLHKGTRLTIEQAHPAYFDKLASLRRGFFCKKIAQMLSRSENAERICDFFIIWTTLGEGVRTQRYGNRKKMTSKAFHDATGEIITISCDGESTTIVAEELGGGDTWHEFTDPEKIKEMAQFLLECAERMEGKNDD